MRWKARHGFGTQPHTQDDLIRSDHSFRTWVTAVGSDIGHACDSGRAGRDGGMSDARFSRAALHATGAVQRGARAGAAAQRKAPNRAQVTIGGSSSGLLRMVLICGILAAAIGGARMTALLRSPGTPAIP